MNEAKIRILIVEDESILALHLQRMLEAIDFVVPARAATGEAAIEKAAELRPDLVLMDIVLKGDMDGILAAEHIQRQLGIPVVYLTAHSDGVTLQRAKVTQPFGYVLKPYDERELLSTIEVALYKHGMEKRLKENEKWLATTLKSIGDAVVTTDTEERVTFMNPVAEALTGWTQAEALGKSSEQVVYLVGGQDGGTVESLAKRALREGYLVDQASRSVLISKDKTEMPVGHNAAPIQDDEGKVTGVVLVFRDVTERKRVEEALREGETRFRNLVETIEECIWEVDTNWVYTYLSPRAHDMYGYEPEELLGKTPYDLMTPVEARRLAELLNRIVSTQEPFMSLEKKCICKDGRMLVLETGGVPFFDADGVLLGYRGVDRDVTERVLLGDALRNRERQFRTLISNIPDAIYRCAIDENWTIHFISDTIEDISGYPASDFMYSRVRTHRSIVHPEDIERVNTALNEKIEKEEPFYLEYRILRAGGDIGWVNEKGQVVVDENEEARWLDGAITDITARKQAEIRLQRLATHDPLTDLPNRTLFSDRLSHAVSLAQRDGKQVAVMFIDLDGFKSVNDTFGHEVGDILLQRVAANLKSCMRESDTVARLAGDEFTICLENISEAKDAAAIAEKILAKLSEPSTLGGLEFTVTASIGISLCPQDGNDAESLLKKADAAMYRVKGTGKNAYQLFSLGEVGRERELID